jgi:hypothetical protein
MEPWRSHSWARSHQLKRLHEETFNNFVNSPGFGVVRMAPLSALHFPSRLENRRTPDEAINQPNPSSGYFLSTDDLQKARPAGRSHPLAQLHMSGLLDFVNVSGFGYIKDRDHVAGFQSHGFSKMPETAELRIQRLELIGLVKHAKPVVYVGKELPRMEELKGAPTRGLSDFELVGVAALARGDDLFVCETPQSVLMVGAIRSVAQCVDCHGGERGDLLGAFSYSLSRVARHDR